MDGNSSRIPVPAPIAFLFVLHLSSFSSLGFSSVQLQHLLAKLSLRTEYCQNGWEEITPPKEVRERFQEDRHDEETGPPPRPRGSRFKDLANLAVEDQKMRELKKCLRDGVDSDDWESFRKSDEEVRIRSTLVRSVAAHADALSS